MVEPPPSDGRRQQRRQDTLEEILHAALDAMGRDGVAGMSLSDVARRVGIRPPSLYEYFPSKLALYDTLFRRGFEQLNAAIRAAAETAGPDPLAVLRAGHAAYVGWCCRHQVLAQLMFWRPVPGFDPSTDAFAPSVAQVEMVRDAIADAVDAGRLDPRALSEEALAIFSCLSSGVVTQQLANEPDGGPDGLYSRHAPAALDLWIDRYTRSRQEDR